ncbi:MAG TPA: flagellar filament capping protein FliD, partial [Rubrivivax sp.]|nr:flagellar filament capping protein FliD [Rubrivivax sp.]
NQGKLDAALANLPEAKNALSNLDVASPANDGFAQRAARLASDLLGVEGRLTTGQAALQKRLQRNSDDQDALNRRVDAYQQRLVRQFSAMDTQVAKLQALGSYVNQQMSALGRLNGSNGR